MKIYINNHLVKTEILPTNTPTLDETLETFSFALKSNKSPIPLAPMQKVKVDFNGDNTDVAYFYIVSDSVETYSLNPLRYKHNISCIQNTRVLSKHLVRNSVFSQPAYLKKSSFNAQSARAYGYEEAEEGTNREVWYDLLGNSIPSLNWASEPLKLDNKEKIKKAYFKISFQYARNPGLTFVEGTKNLSALVSELNGVSSISWNGNFQLRYKNSNGVLQTPETLNPAEFGVSDFDLNGQYEFDRIKTLAEQGYNSFEILFTNDKFLEEYYLENAYADRLDYMAFYMFQVEIVAETYYYTAYDILDLLIKRQKKEDSKNVNPAPLFSLPAPSDDPSSLYYLLSNTVAPNFAFTDLTMYECVAEVFRLFDAIFTMDENGVLGIEFFNDLSGAKINHKKFTGRTLSLGEDKYTNGIVTNYQDARIEESFPSGESYAPLRSEEFGVPDAQDHHFIVPHKIYSITKCEILNHRMIPWQNFWITGDINVDITRYVYEKDVWSILDKGGFNEETDLPNRAVKQANTIYYSRGSNKIDVAFTFKSSWNITHYSLYNAVISALSRMTGLASPVMSASNDFKGDWKDIRMRVTYIATIDGKTKVHSLTNKYEGETLIDQNNGAVDLNKMGLNMLGTVLKLGNPTLNASHKITSWDKRIRTGQIFKDEEGRIWVANVVNYTWLNGFIQGKISFVQNFNQLSLRTRLLREKRMTNISEELIQKSEEILTDFIYYSSIDPAGLNLAGDDIRFGKGPLTTFLHNSFNVVGSYAKINNVFVYSSRNEVSLLGYIKDAVYIPLAAYGAGNTINFEVSFEHPMNAGNQTTYTSNWVGETKYFTNHAIYTDESGFLDDITVKAVVFDMTYDQRFPLIDIPDTGILGGYLFKIDNLKIYKQPNEIFALNYQLAFLPLPGRENTDFIGNTFINNNCFVKDFSAFSARKIYICLMAEESSVLDTKAVPYIARKKVTQVTAPGSQNNYITRLNFTFEAATAQQLSDAVSWAICDEDSNILFASNNKEGLTTSQVSIWFMTKLNRLI